MGAVEKLRLALSITEERLSIALASAHVGLWEVDLQTGVRWFSDIAKDIMGHPANDAAVYEDQSLDAVHPEDRERVRSTVRAMIENDDGCDREFEYRLRRSDGEGPIWAVSTGRVVRDVDGTPLRVIGSVRDVTVSRRSRDELARMAFEDDYTRLPNRRGLMRILDQACRADTALCLLILDIDDFKRTIDLIGSRAADRLIEAFATRLRKMLPPQSCLARMDGDEFAITVPHRVTGSDGQRISKALHTCLRRPFMMPDGRAVFVEVSIGMASIDPDTRSVEDVLARASLSLREAKATAKGRTVTFTPAMQSVRVQAQTLLQELPRAVSSHEFKVHYQPQVKLSDRSLSGAEALLRWGHPQRGLLSPASFIDALSRSRWASVVGTQVLETACRDAARLIGSEEPLLIGVNLFGAQFQGSKLDQVVRRATAKHGITADRLEIEITENIVLADDADVLRSLKKLRDLGCGIAFDDYGTGYASLSMLKRYPITRLKIDRSFVSNICDSPADRAIVDAVLGLGRTFGIDVIAEGIETEAQHATLVEGGCTHAQGYLYGKPAPFRALVDRLDPSAVQQVA